MNGPLTTSSASCPVPIREYPQVLLAHGGGGRLMHELLEKVFLPAFSSLPPELRHDSTVVEVPGSRIAFTTDSYVVKPLFFPGGDIGSLAVHGTVNDLAMAGARPLCLSAAFIIEEGCPMDTLARVVGSMRTAAAQCGVPIVTGDTKVVDRGKGDALFINTAGIGIVDHSLRIAPASIQPGDAILVSGDIGRHGMAIMAVREGLEFESAITSDSAPLHQMVADLLSNGVQVHCLRDLTRGGLTSALNELATASGLTMNIAEELVPVRNDVVAACEILGLDPLQSACEGRMVALVAEAQSTRALEIMRSHEPGRESCRIGIASSSGSPRVLLKCLTGVERVLDMGSGEQLPRIC